MRSGKIVLSIKYIYNIILYCFGWIFSLSSDCINIVVPKFRRHRKYRKRKRLNTFYATAKLWMCECKHDSYISLYSQIFILVFRLVHYHIRSSFRFDFRDLIHPTIFYVRLSKAQINYISTSIYWNYTLRIKWISISNAFIQIFVIWLFYFLAERFCNHCSQLDSGGDDNSNNRPISSQQTEVWCSLFSTSYHSICMNVCKQRTGGLYKCTT